MYKIKQIPSDFLVYEKPIYNLKKEGNYTYFWLKKENLTTTESIKKIALQLNIPQKWIGYAGNKDKIAITKQIISIKNCNLKKINNIFIKNLSLTLIGKGSSPISLGDLKENQFKITVRNLSNKLSKLISSKTPNFYGPQRFSKSNIEIGKNIVKKNFKKAIELIDNFSVKDYINSNPGDFAGALRTLPLRLRKIYIHAYQSHIWNNIVKEYLLSNPIKNETIPIPGFGSTIPNTPIGKIINSILKKENLSLRDFIIPQMPELSSEGSERLIFVTPKNFSIAYFTDELNNHKNKAIINFSLPKSSYATIIIDNLFKH